MSHFRLGSQLSRMAAQASSWRDRYHEQSIPLPFDPHRESLFLPIRHFNSDTPITPGQWEAVPFNIAIQPLYSGDRSSLPVQPSRIGGGYFLWHQGAGVAIDPGHGFVDSLHRYHGLTVHSIDAVIITHDHLDHHADLETIITLRRGGVGSGALKVFANEQVSDVYGLEARTSQKWSEIVFMKVPDHLENPNDQPIAGDVHARFIPAAHWQRVRTEFPSMNGRRPLNILKNVHFNSFGLQLSFGLDSNAKRVLITSDTVFPTKSDPEDLSSGWEIRIPKRNNLINPYLDDDKARMLGWVVAEVMQVRGYIDKLVADKAAEMAATYASLPRSDVVCLHIGSLEKSLKNVRGWREDEIIQARHDPSYCYPGVHLGLMGAVRVFEVLAAEHANDPEKGFDSQNGLIVLTEFGEELLGNRQNVCTTFRQLARVLVKDMNGDESNGIAVVPSEVTLRLRLDHTEMTIDLDQGIACSYCGDYHPWNSVVGREGPGEIITFANGPRDEIFANCAYWNR